MENENNKYYFGKIYKIFDKDTNECYIGSTTTTIEKRLQAHKNHYNEYLKNRKAYISSFDILKNNNYDIELIQEVKYENKTELLQREQYHINLNKCCNKHNAFGWNKEKFKEKNKEYREKNKETKKEYRIMNFGFK